MEKKPLPSLTDSNSKGSQTAPILIEEKQVFSLEALKQRMQNKEPKPMLKIISDPKFLEYKPTRQERIKKQKDQIKVISNKLERELSKFRIHLTRNERKNLAKELNELGFSTYSEAIEANYTYNFEEKILKALTFENQKVPDNLQSLSEQKLESIFDDTECQLADSLEGKKKKKKKKVPKFRWYEDDDYCS